jgi:hypothetical protein
VRLFDSIRKWTPEQRAKFEALCALADALDKLDALGLTRLEYQQLGRAGRTIGVMRRNRTHLPRGLRTLLRWPPEARCQFRALLQRASALVDALPYVPRQLPAPSVTVTGGGAVYPL